MPVTIPGIPSFIYVRPTGYIGTIILLEAKLVIQYLWRKNIDWDESIPEDLVKC